MGNTILNLTMFLCLCAEREAVDENQKNLRPNVVVSAGPVIVVAPEQSAAQDVKSNN